MVPHSFFHSTWALALVSFRVKRWAASTRSFGNHPPPEWRTIVVVVVLAVAVDAAIPRPPKRVDFSILATGMHSVIANIRPLFLVASDCNFPHPLSRVQQRILLLLMLMDDAAGKIQVVVVVVVVKIIMTMLGKPQIDPGSGEWQIRVVVEEEQMNRRREAKGGTVVGVTLQEGAGAHHQHCC